jgi:hypothetical protein
MRIQRLFGLVMLAVGNVLLIMGIRETDAFASHFTKLFTGSPTDRAMWLTLVGVVLIIVGGSVSVLPLLKRG